jgi:hypothetical protein
MSRLVLALLDFGPRDVLPGFEARNIYATSCGGLTVTEVQYRPGLLFR